MGDIVEGNMAGVHLEECVSGFGLGGKWNVRGLSGKERERRGGLFGHSGIERVFQVRNRREVKKKRE